MFTLNQILDTEFPFIQGGMANVATGRFAADVANAGALGLIGCGRIATMAANYMKGFNFRVVGVDPYLPKEIAEANGIELLQTREEVAEVADIVISHIPVIKSREDQVDARFFNACKKHPVFVNAARGASVNYEDLTEEIGRASCRERV